MFTEIDTYTNTRFITYNQKSLFGLGTLFLAKMEEQGTNNPLFLRIYQVAQEDFLSTYT